MKKYYLYASIVTVVCLLVGFVGGLYNSTQRGIPFVRQREQWSIGIYTGESPFLFPAAQNGRNPVLRAEDVTDVPARFVADPFLVQENSAWYLFFEVYNWNSQQGDIAVATSDDARTWNYEQVVLDEPFHLSYPYVFKWQNDYYLIPESFEAKAIRLYKAVDFPTKWAFVETLIADTELVDPSIVHFKEKWWLFASTTSNDTLHLYFADHLEGSWREHPESPIVRGDKNIARPGGRVLVYDNRIFRYTQDGEPTYGNQIWAFEITELTTTSYQEQKVSEAPIVKASGSGWNAQAIHNIDPHQIGEKEWIASVDGFGKYLVFGLQY